ncbi:hypothetical protein KM176_16430 [Pseudooceanicola sp. CBS1P-1]|uniref:Type 4 secretion system PilS N-terminal domain-containing protein n=1 Tax=Pseudooceanicola albus TaxID=2692189 RepID=A0A6L7G6V2_9RHOB|nr:MULTISPECIES: type 4 pilus major pilin [Pseudooceanicola]MBT9385462.1 hypothetical protein [Pseudooceanicola endophyticus]MXN19126.1 hypothetical protein [Pseudooceanicola albus]
MPEIDEIATVIGSGDLSTSDLMVMFCQSLDAGGKVTVANFLAAFDIAIKGAAANFTTSTITNLTAQTAIITSLQFLSGKTITNLYAGSVTVTLADTDTLTAQTVTATLTGATTAMHLQAALTEALPDGLILQGAWISAADTISFKVYNVTDTLIAGASYTARVAAFSIA